ncbi:alpha-toxin CvIV4-like [Centruroides sculpturatus]|uniref:alpha-toxin CvIV4-like n=1 Tax=Centruroides sculpturatus TaxID=218467 RepID=UPI000C6CF0FA|nr:alpha-toxin CvIV4-like [Centruroides sculpturatus]
MNYFILLFVATFLLLDVNCKKDGYPVDANNCKFECWGNEYCDKLCKGKRAESGYCWKWKLSCWCEGLPDDEPIKTSDRCYGTGK